MNIDLRLGDCLELMRKIPGQSIDCIVTSPPYNLMGQYSHKSQMKQSFSSNRIDEWYEDAMPENIYQEWQIECLNEMVRVCRGVIFYNHQVRYAWGRKGKWYHPVHWLTKGNFVVWCEIIWNRGSGISGAKRPVLTEQRIYMIGKPKTYNNMGLTNVWNISPERNSHHVCPLPISIYERCIAMVTRSGDIVLDPFMGTGNGGIASLKMKRKFVGIEKNEWYFEIAKQRIENAGNPNSIEPVP